MSNLSAFNFLPERSEATPGLWNSPLSIISANIAAINSDLTVNFPSGNTLSLFTGLEVSGGIHAQYVSVGSTPASNVTTAAVVIGVDSAFSDYIHFTDSSGARSDYVLGSRAGGTADGLNIWDASGATMIVSFSKQSVRFWQNVVGPAFDLGGAVFHVHSFGAIGDGVIDDTSAIQAGIDTASAAGGTLYFSHGTYLVGNSGTYALSCNTAMKFLGDGGAAIKLKTGMALGSEILRINTAPSTMSVSNVEIDSLNFDGSNQSRMFGLRAMYTNRLLVNNCQFEGFYHKSLANPGYCIYASGSTVSLPASPFAWGAATPTGWASGTRISGCRFSSTTSGSFGTLGAHGVFVYLHDGAIISQNVFDTCATPIMALGWIRQLTINENVVQNSTDDGIRFEADESVAGTKPEDMEGVVCTGNVIRNTFKDGIRASCNKSIIANNVSAFNTLGGITAVVMRNSLVANNEVYHNQNRGIYLTRTTISGFSTHENVLITGNYCNNNGIAGIDVIGGGDASDSVASHIVIHNNLVTENSAIGISLRDCSAARVTHNLVHSNNTSDVSSNGIGLVHQVNLVAAGAGNSFFGWNRIYDPRPATRALQNVAVELFATAGKTLGSNEFYYNDISGTPSNGSFTNRGFWTTAGGTVNGNLFVGNKVQTAGSPWLIQSTDTVVTHSALGPIQHNAGTAILPSIAFSSESSLGWYQSAASGMGLSYGQLQLPDGLPLRPAYAWSSESSFGFFRSGASTMELSYGSLRLDGGILSLGSGGISTSTWKFTVANSLTLSQSGSVNYFILAVPQAMQDGSAAIPSLTYTSDTPTGWYRSGRSHVGLTGSLSFAIGSNITPPITFSSESSLGLYRSGVSTIGLSYGAFAHPDGSNTTPTIGFSSNTSLGFYSSGVQTIAQSLGTLNLATNSVRLSVRTAASLDSTNLAVNEMAFTFIASGASLGIRSGSTIYYFTSSASTKA